MIPSAVQLDARSLQYRNGPATGMTGTTSLNHKLCQQGQVSEPIGGYLKSV
jgi:hypothetical protein